MILENKVCIITGAGAGIGKGIAEVFAENGAIVIIATKLESEGKCIEKDLREKNLKADFMQTDVSDINSINNLVENVSETYGRIDVLVNNAGVTFFKEFENVKEEEWDLVMGVDVKGIFFLSQAVTKIMKKTGGSIINIASNHAYCTLEDSEVYAAAKSAVIGLSKGMSLTLGKYNIRVNSICPGFTNTPHHQRWMEEKEELLEHVEFSVKSLHPLGKIAEPRDIGQAAMFLAAPELSSSITGSELVIDGGLKNKLFSKNFIIEEVRKK